MLVRVGDDGHHGRDARRRAGRRDVLAERRRRGAGGTCIRLSVFNWQTTAEDVDRSVAALARAARGARSRAAAPGLGV